MNYRHDFHAGNFADVLKHVVLARVVRYLQGKDKAFRVLDTHAGPGEYDLSGEAASRTGEWRDGIGRLLSSPLPAAAAGLLEPYLAALRIEGGALRRYPGSPLIVRRLLRPQDRLTAVELHPASASRLKRLFSGDVQVRVIELDGWLSLGSHVPPTEKRGLVLVDPPFEQPGEFERLAEGFERARRRWPGGTYLLWYPIKDRQATERFRQTLAGSGAPNLIDVRLEVRGPSAEPRLDGCGVVVANPPFTLPAEFEILGPVLRDRLGREKGARFELATLSGEARPLDR